MDIVAGIVNKAHNIFLAMINDAQTIPYLRVMLRDLATLSQVLARTLPIVQITIDVDNHTRLEEVVTKVVEVAHSLLMHITQLPASANNGTNRLYIELIQTEAQLFTSISYLIPISSVITSNQVAILNVFDNAVQFLIKMSTSPNISENEMLLTAIGEFLTRKCHSTNHNASETLSLDKTFEKK